MDKSRLVVATLTWARNQEEEALLRKSLTELAKLEIPVYITDAGSGTSFLNFLGSYSHFIINSPRKGVWMQAKNSLFEAYQANTPFIMYTEPDKTDFFVQSLPTMLNSIVEYETTGIILASRSSKAFASFPSFQQMTETTINNCCAELIGKRVDYTYGPFLLNKKLLPFIEHLPENIGWGWRPYAFAIAARLGLSIESFTGDFCCPPLQASDDPSERIYRMRQLSQNIEGLTRSTSFALPQL